MQITEQQKQDIIRLIHGTWGTVSADAADTLGITVASKDLVAELCIDGDRYRNMVQGMDSTKQLVQELLRHGGWTLGDFAALLPHKRYDTC